MPTDSRYGTATTTTQPGAEPPIAADEPIFILRARDTFANATLLTHKTALKNAGMDPKILAGVDATLEAFAAWQAKNDTYPPGQANDK